MLMTINLMWQRTQRHPVARLTVRQVRALLETLAHDRHFPMPAMHCDARVQARDISISAHSIAVLAKVLDADHTTIGILDEAHFTRSKVRILVCPFTGDPMLAVSPVIDIDIPHSYFRHIARELPADHNRFGSSFGSIRLDDLIENYALNARGVVFDCLCRAQNQTTALAPYLPEPRTVLLTWQDINHQAAPTEPLTFPRTLVKGEYTLDPGTGRLFAVLQHGSSLLDVCIGGPSENPAAWDQVLAIGPECRTTRIGTYRETPAPEIIIDHERGTTTRSYVMHHDEAVPQPTLRADDLLPA